MVFKYLMLMVFKEQVICPKKEDYDKNIKDVVGNMCLNKICNILRIFQLPVIDQEFVISVWDR